MRKLVSLLLILVCTVVWGGCANTAKTPSKGAEKQLLELEHHLDPDFDSAEGIEIQSKAVSIPYDAMAETDWTSVSSTASLGDILETVREDYPDLSFEKWEYQAHLAADDGSWGNIRLRYRVGSDIVTNKAITCSYQNGAIQEITYTNMGFALTDDEEQELIRRAEEFLNTHVQEKKDLQENERFLKERTEIIYYCNLDRLVYSYASFFEYDADGDPTVIHDRGTEYFIE